MPQVKEPLIRRLIKKALNEAELSAGPDNTKFGIKILVSNPQSETKQGIRIQLRPSEGFLDPDAKSELSAAIMTKFNESLKQFNLQISLDTDTQDPEAMGFFIPLEQLQNMIEVALGAKKDDEIAPPPPIPGDSRPTPPKPPTDIPDTTDDKEELNEEDGLDRAERGVKDLGDSMDKWKSGLNLKRSGYQDEKGGELTLQELYDKLDTAYELLVDIFKDIYQSDYKFKTYYENNEDEITRTMGAIAMIKDDVEDRLEQEEPVGPDQGIEELKKVIKKIVKEQSEPLNEMRQRTLNEISKVVVKEDFYDFINKGNNILRSCENGGIEDGKKYLIYLVKHNIM